MTERRDKRDIYNEECAVILDECMKSFDTTKPITKMDILGAFETLVYRYDELRQTYFHEPPITVGQTGGEGNGKNLLTH